MISAIPGRASATRISSWRAYSASLLPAYNTTSSDGQPRQKDKVPVSRLLDICLGVARNHDTLRKELEADEGRYPHELVELMATEWRRCYKCSRYHHNHLCLSVCHFNGPMNRFFYGEPRATRIIIASPAKLKKIISRRRIVAMPARKNRERALLSSPEHVNTTTSASQGMDSLSTPIPYATPPLLPSPILSMFHARSPLHHVHSLRPVCHGCNVSRHMHSI